jgi:hypothetical protein
MGKKKPEIETEMRSLLPEEVQECSQQLAALVEERKAIKRRQKEGARGFKQQLESNEEEQERLSRMIITQQEELPIKRQMTLAEIEDQRRHEMSIEEFQRETDAFDLGKETPAASIAENGDVVETSTGDEEEEQLMDGERRWPYPEIRVSRKFIEDGGPMDKSSSIMLIMEGKLHKPFDYDGKLWVELGSVSQNLRTLSRDCYVAVRREDYEGPEPKFYEEFDRDGSRRRVGYVGIRGIYKKQEYVIIDGPFTFLPDDVASSTTSPEAASTPEPAATKRANGSKKKRLTIHDLAKQMEHMGPVSRGDLHVLGYRESTIESAVIHKLIKIHTKGLASHGDTFVLASADDPLDLVPDDKHGRSWRDLSDMELDKWKEKLTGQKSNDRLREIHGAQKCNGWYSRVWAIWRERDAAWQKADAAGGDR